ncbi:CorA family divalent cation transporter, partial [Roseomonas sp. 18066]|uniref:CorA family divalent cation transporter n=1 Tax=Roseomonas sp. 18066 TaxID=2681412 RepID=UPI001359223A
PGPGPGPLGRVWQLDLPGGWRWTHYDLVQPGSLPAIRAEGWGEAALAVMHDKDESPRLEVEGEVVCGILPDFAQQSGPGEQLLASWRFAMTPTQITTARRAAPQGLYRAWRAVQGGQVPDGPAALLDQVLAQLGAGISQRADALDDEARRVEDELLAETPARTPQELGRKLGEIRRQTTRLQRLAVPVMRLVREETGDLPDWADAETHAVARRRMLAALDDLRALQEHGRALQDELSARQAAETNRNLNLLSVLTAVLLPPTLVSGFFGMNTEGLPWAGDGGGTAWAAALMLASMGGTLALLRLRRIV